MRIQAQGIAAQRTQVDVSGVRSNSRQRQKRREEHPRGRTDCDSYRGTRGKLSLWSEQKTQQGPPDGQLTSKPLKDGDS
jgi:hypothetical protein